MSKDDSDLQVEDRFLAAMGLKGLKGDDKIAALDSIITALNTNVGRRIIENFTPEQAEDFERLSRPGSDPEKLVYWLAVNVPNYKQILEEETRKLRDDTANFVDEMMKKSAADAPNPLDKSEEVTQSGV